MALRLKPIYQEERQSNPPGVASLLQARSANYLKAHIEAYTAAAEGRGPTGDAFVKNVQELIRHLLRAEALLRQKCPNLPELPDTPDPSAE